VQKALEVAGGEDRNQLLDRLRGHVVTLVESPHGNHVIQKCIEALPPHSVQFVVDELAAFPGSWPVLARHRYGCRVIERLIEHCTEEMTHPIMTAVVANSHTLWSHPFGNYVVQHIFEYGSKAHCNQIISAMSFTGDIVSLAQHRVASNVLERALEKCGPQGQQALVCGVLSNPSGLLTLGCNRYGSFVVRRLLDVCTPTQREEALCQLRAGASQLRTSKFGKHLFQYVDTLESGETH
jgi:pumilio RNA-binding family